jgi:hypothetical protein
MLFIVLFVMDVSVVLIIRLFDWNLMFRKSVILMFNTMNTSFKQIVIMYLC